MCVFYGVWRLLGRLKLEMRMFRGSRLWEAQCDVFYDVWKLLGGGSRSSTRLRISRRPSKTVVFCGVGGRGAAVWRVLACAISRGAVAFLRKSGAFQENIEFSRWSRNRPDYRRFVL